jgi:hypothetical protein
MAVLLFLLDVPEGFGGQFLGLDLAAEQPQQQIPGRAEAIHSGNAIDVYSDLAVGPIVTSMISSAMRTPSAVPPALQIT